MDLYVHPVTRLLCCKPESRWVYRGGAFLRASAALRRFGIAVGSAKGVGRYRIDGLRVWERRDCGWFVHTYRYVPEQVIRLLTRSDGREVPIYSMPRYECIGTKQASKKEIRDVLSLLWSDPLAVERRKGGSDR